MANPIVSNRNPLPLSLDVAIFLSRPSTEIATDMTMICFATPDVDFPPGNGRIQFFSSIDAVYNAVPQNSAAYFAAMAFFSRSERPGTMAIGRVFTEPTNATLYSGNITVNNLKSIDDGEFNIAINGETVTVDELDFTVVTSLAEIAATLNTAMTAYDVTVTVEGSGILLKSVNAGNGNTLSYATSAPEASGTDVSSLLALTNDLADSNTIGYTPGDLVSEIGLIRQAAKNAGRPFYGLVIDAKYRDTQDQKNVADWAESVEPMYFSACTNSANAYDASSEANIGAYANARKYTRTSVIYYHKQQLYPDISYLALALSVNYALDDSTLTMKFKELDGFEPSPINETQLTALEHRRINCYVAIGNNSVEIREGMQSADGWFTDSRVNLDNYVNELQTEVYNVFKRNKKIPYTTPGQDKLVSAASKINRRYARNGTFAQRDIEDDSEVGFRTEPATTIIPTPVYRSTMSERADRTAPPIQIIAYEAGAMHRVSIYVNVYN